MKFRLLIVDDNLAIQMTLKESLKSLDLDMEFASSGLEAIEKLEDFRPNLILLDIMMPVMNGLETLKRLRSMKGMEELPVILISAKTGLENRIIGYRTGATHYLEKPFEIRELRALVGSFLGQHKSLNNELDSELSELSFTKMEKKILDVFLSHIEGVVSRKFICEQLEENSKPFGNSRFLDNHISSLRKKLIGSDFQLETVYGEGYKLIKLFKSKKVS